MGTQGDENALGQPDKNSVKKKKVSLSNLSSMELIELWKGGSNEAASVLVARYEIRLLALIETRLSQRYRGNISPEEVVQSAFGSFFRVARNQTQFAFVGNSEGSAWNLLATFARRKLSRKLERAVAQKRGGGQSRIPLDEVYSELAAVPNQADVSELIRDLEIQLTPEEKLLWDSLLAGVTQREIAERLHVEERTIRRRIHGMKEKLCGLDVLKETVTADRAREDQLSIPKISYREFVLGKLVGQGRLGKVYRARLQSNSELVAVKFMHRQYWENESGKSSFLQEIEQAAKIDHPSVVKYFGWGSSPHGGPYLVTEYVDGQTLWDADFENENEKIIVLRQVCNAIAATHLAGVVHGDLTQSNILVTREGRAVVTDFGLAASLSRRGLGLSEHGETQLRGGTLGFAAPEQISAAFGEIGTATDIYAIGGLAYFLLTGHVPHWPKESVVLQTVSEEDIVIKYVPKSETEKRLLEVVLLCLKKNVSSRPQNIQVVLEVLER